MKRGLLLKVHQFVFGKETPAQYRARHKRKGYHASNGRTYDHKETRDEYNARKAAEAFIRAMRGRW